MNIDNLTLGEARALAAMFATPAVGGAQPAHPFVGRYVICRGTWSGVHAGELISKDGAEIVLRDSRRLWSWTAKKGIALSGVAQHGYKDGKIDVLNPLIAISDCIECIPAAAGVRESINAIA